MILGQDKPHYSNLKLEFGQYCQLYENNRNKMTPRSVDGIALRPKNDRGSYYFMSLEIGRRIHAWQWTVLHVTESVIGRVDQLSANEGINVMVDGEMLFGCNPGYPELLQPNYKEVISP